MGKGCVVGRGSGVDGVSGMGRGCDKGRGTLGAGCSLAARARALVAAECASGFAHLPNCSPAPYGSPSAAHLQFGSPMCWAVSALLTLPFSWCFTPIHTAVSGQEC